MTDKDIDKKLKKMEEQLDAITSSLSTPGVAFNPDSRFPAAIRSDEIDLRELFGILWQGKWWIIGITFLFAVAGVIYAKSLPNMYKSEGIYAPAQEDGTSVGAQLGGLASLAGVSFGGAQGNDVDQAIALIKSWPFQERLITEQNLKPFIMAVKGWDKHSRKLIWDTDVYDPESGQWLSSGLEQDSAEPTSFEVYEVLRESIFADYDKKVGMVSLSVEHYSPEMAKQWLEIIVAAVNEHFQQRDMLKAKRSIDYLEKKINETSIAEMQAVFYGMIQVQTKTLMLAEVDDQYLFEEVVGPKVAEKKSAPKRGVIVVIFAFLGGTLSIVAVLARGMLVSSKV